MKPFAKTPRKTVTVTIEENGDLTFLATESADIFLELGETVTRRASHVEPADLWHRIRFHILRSIFSDKSAVAAYTRTWKCLWRVNTSPVGGPILHYWDVPSSQWVDGMYTGKHGELNFSDRQAAIDAEITFLNHWFAERGI